MYLIKIFFIFSLIIFLPSLKAFEYKNSNYLEFIYGNASISNSENNYANPHYLIDITTFNDITFDYFSITSTLYFSGSTDNYSRTYNHEVLEENHLEFSEFAFNGFITKNDILTIGLLSFKHGSLSEYSKIGLIQSDALYTMYYLTMPGIFYTHHITNGKIQIGYSQRTKYEISPTNRYEHTAPGSDIAFLFGSKNYLNNNLKFKFNASVSDITYTNLDETDDVSLGNLYMVGLGVSYDTINYSVYGILASSVTDFDGTKLTLDGNELILPPGYTDPDSPGTALTDEGYRYGYSIFLGAKKIHYIPSIKKDIYFGTEYFYASKYWVSAVTDEYNKDSYSWGDLGNTYKIYGGISITPKLNTSINFKYSDINYQKLKGGNSVIESDLIDKRLYLRLDYIF
jgi:hypothetical protein